MTLKLPEWTSPFVILQAGHVGWGCAIPLGLVSLGMGWGACWLTLGLIAFKEFGFDIFIERSNWSDEGIDSIFYLCGLVLAGIVLRCSP